MTRRTPSGEGIPDGFPLPENMPNVRVDADGNVTSDGSHLSSKDHLEMIHRAMALVQYSLLEATPWMPISIEQVAEEFDTDMAAAMTKDRRRAPSDEAIQRISRRLAWLNYLVKTFELSFGSLPLDLTDEYFTLRLGTEAIGLMRFRQDQQELIDMMHLAEEDDDYDLMGAIQSWVPMPDPSHSRMLRMPDEKKDAAIAFQVRHRVEGHGDVL